MGKTELENLLSLLDNWAAFFTLLVVIGVGGELFVHIKYSRTSKRLIAMQHDEEKAREAEIARLGKEAAESGKGIADANARAAEANAHAAKAEEHLGAANERASQAYERAAQAEREAAKFNETAERERLARLKLEAALTPRSLSIEQHRDMVAKLRGYSGQRLDIFIYGDATEIVRTANLIGGTVRDAGWNVKLWATMSSGVAVTGILVSTRAGSPATVEHAANSLISALNSGGMSSTLFTPFTGTEIPAAINGPNWDTNDIAPIRIMVGAKP